MTECKCNEAFNSNMNMKTKYIVSRYIEPCCFETICKQGYDVNKPDIKGFSFMQRVGTKKQLDIALKYGGDINLKDKYGLTPLFWAVICDNGDPFGKVYDIYVGRFKTLLKKGADFRHKENNGLTIVEFIQCEKEKVIGHKCMCHTFKWFANADGSDISEDAKCRRCGNIEDLSEMQHILNNHCKKHETLFDLVKPILEESDKKRRF